MINRKAIVALVLLLFVSSSVFALSLGDLGSGVFSKLRSLFASLFSRFFGSGSIVKGCCECSGSNPMCYSDLTRDECEARCDIFYTSYYFHTSGRICSDGHCVTPTTTTLSCTPRSCCGCHTKYGDDCSCDIYTNGCTSLCPTTTTTTIKSTTTTILPNSPGCAPWIDSTQARLCTENCDQNCESWCSSPDLNKGLKQSLSVRLSEGKLVKVVCAHNGCTGQSGCQPYPCKDVFFKLDGTGISNKQFFIYGWLWVSSDLNANPPTSYVGSASECGSAPVYGCWIRITQAGTYNLQAKTCVEQAGGKYCDGKTWDGGGFYTGQSCIDAATLAVT